MQPIPITPKQKEFLEVYNNKAFWRPPSYSNLAKAMGWKSKNAVSKMLKRLEHKDLIKTKRCTNK